MLNVTGLGSDPKCKLNALSYWKSNWIITRPCREEEASHVEELIVVTVPTVLPGCLFPRLVFPVWESCLVLKRTNKHNLEHQNILGDMQNYKFWNPHAKKGQSKYKEKYLFMRKFDYKQVE